MYQHEAEQLRQIASRIESLESEKAGLQEDIKEAYEDAKSAGFQPKVLRKAIKARKTSASERQAEQDLIDLYLAAIDGQTDMFKASEELETTITLNVPGRDPVTCTGEEFKAAASAITRRGLRRRATEPAELH